MSINLNRSRIRQSVVWLGSLAPEEAQRVLREREYRVEQATKEMLQNAAYLSGICAVVFRRDPKYPEGIVNDLRAHAQQLLDHDCNVIIRSSPAGLPLIIDVVNELAIPIGGVPLPEATGLKSQDYQDGDPALPCAQYFSDAATWASIANFISDSPPGPAPNPDLTIVLEPAIVPAGEQQDVALTDSERILLQRAFSDCSDVHLIPITKGNSGADVYRACAELIGALHGQWPQPYFVKLGSREKILGEYTNYIGHVDPYVPFHLGPHLVRDRCCVGSAEGILVGDYVEESEDLCDCAPAGRSAPAIACLFDKTLLGWHRHARKEMTPISEGLLARFPRRINAARMEKAQELGAKQSLASLRSLFECCTSTPVLVGPVHGDLHSGNVRVRATDAIIIDFLQHCDYPLVFDAACLEASLLVEGFGTDRRTPQKWMESLKPLYDSPPLDDAVSHANPRNPSFWFHASVHQIRRYARQWECGANQYAATLALAMLIKAVKDPNALERESYRRAGAYLIAEKILSNTFGKRQ